MNVDEQISWRIRKLIKEKHGSGSNLAKNLNITPQALNDSIADIRKGKYPSVKKLKKIAEACDCQITDFFNI
ncbi:MAG: helix-turn-helix transcriptional regulator [Cetobacterium sp.]